MAKNNPTNKTYEQISEWLNIYHAESDVRKKERAKTLIVTHMYPVVRNIAKTIARRASDPIDDMVQAGFIGLLKAIDKFDSSVNDNFRVYAGYFIIGEIKHYLRDQLTAIKVPRHIQELTIRIYNFTKNLTYEEVQDLTSEEVASALNESTRNVDLAFLAERRRSIYSLDEIFLVNEGSLNYEELLVEKNYKEKTAYEDVRIIFQQAIDRLPPEEKVLIDMYYNQDMNKKDIAKAMVSTQMSIARKLKKAFEMIAELVFEHQTGLDEIIVEEEAIDGDA